MQTLINMRDASKKVGEREGYARYGSAASEQRHTCMYLHTLSALDNARAMPRYREALARTNPGNHERVDVIYIDPFIPFLFPQISSRNKI